MESAAIYIGQSMQQRHSPARILDLFKQNGKDPDISVSRTKILIPVVRTIR